MPKKRKEYKKLTDSTLSMIESLRKGGLTLEDIAKATDLSCTSVKKAIRELKKVGRLD